MTCFIQVFVTASQQRSNLDRNESWRLYTFMNL